MRSAISRRFALAFSLIQSHLVLTIVTGKVISNAQHRLVTELVAAALWATASFLLAFPCIDFLARDTMPIWVIEVLRSLLIFIFDLSAAIVFTTLIRRDDSMDNWQVCVDFMIFDSECAVASVVLAMSWYVAILAFANCGLCAMRYRSILPDWLYRHLQRKDVESALPLTRDCLRKGATRRAATPFIRREPRISHLRYELVPDELSASGSPSSVP
ncbi:hypothetical protein PUNSTDRAFT_141762 [Punctularia strigosozonata HHB-11173 SS5]|uniref:uncharacterized protein n=1 Tax=Punctularia strigosozonata (strain HHB-11173) TaxID=741275 RepID=UPI0004418717|nr:uncharacterized protein PUNSTDRAFT_141762 [Punctularia strigosozonata HHB-11173 SS5]EIN11381.1 hypothetical protein PUNSTDRAFT_141762 [Punctularia strigosozonata HHB-11173 SS5]